MKDSNPSSNEDCGTDSETPASENVPFADEYPYDGLMFDLSFVEAYELHHQERVDDATRLLLELFDHHVDITGDEWLLSLPEEKRDGELPAIEIVERAKDGRLIEHFEQILAQYEQMLDYDHTWAETHDDPWGNDWETGFDQ